MTDILLSKGRPAGSVLNLEQLVQSRLLIQGGSGSGKSTLARLILERSAGKIQQIVLDPEGEFRTLRKVGDYLLCASDGDVPTDVKSAALLAKRIRQTGVSAIVDIYELNAMQRKAFARAFLEGLIAAPKKYWRESLVFVDETHKFAPQSQASVATEAVQDLADRGRKRKLCLICATHRQSKLNKDVVAEMQNRIVGQTGLKGDLVALAGEMGLSYKECRQALVTLKAGEFLTFGPAIGPEYLPIAAVLPKTEAATADTKPVAASASLAKVIESLSDLPSQAKKEAETLAELKNENAQLKRKVQLFEKTGGTIGVSPAEVERRVGAARAEGIQEASAQSNIDVGRIRECVQEIAALLPGDAPAEKKRRPHSLPPVSDDGYTVAPAVAKRAAPATVAGLGKGETKVLIAIAQHDDGVDRDQVTILTGYKRSTRNAYIQRLQSAGLIDVGPPITITSEGSMALPADFQPLPVGDALLQHWLSVLPLGEKAVLEVAAHYYPAGVSREGVSVETGYKRSTRNAYIQRLMLRKLLVVRGQDLNASPALFDNSHQATKETHA